MRPVFSGLAANLNLKTGGGDRTGFSDCHGWLRHEPLKEFGPAKIRCNRRERLSILLAGTRLELWRNLAVALIIRRGLFLLKEREMKLLRLWFPRSDGIHRVDGRLELSGIKYANRYSLHWCDAPKEFGSNRNLRNRWKQRSRMGVFTRMPEGLEAQDNQTANVRLTDDCCYAAWFDEALIERGVDHCIRLRRGRKSPISHDPEPYKPRYCIENSFARSKDWRSMATRYDRCPEA